MAKLYYEHGVMLSGKSMDLLKVYTNYVKTGRNCLIMSPTTDTRSGKAQVKSRLGEAVEATPFSPDDDLFTMLAMAKKHDPKLACVLIDEAQFMTAHQVDQLAMVVDELGLPVMCYGLKNTFKNTLFEGSQELLIMADEIKEIKTVCQYCNKKATMNLLRRNGQAVFSGDDVFIGDLEFSPVCREHYERIKNATLNNEEIK